MVDLFRSCLERHLDGFQDTQIVIASRPPPGPDLGRQLLERRGGGKREGGRGEGGNEEEGKEQEGM